MAVQYFIRKYRSHRLFMMMTSTLLLLSLIGLSSCRSHTALMRKRSESAMTSPFIEHKSELRAVWWPTVFRSEYAMMTPLQMQADFDRKLDYLHKIGFNAIIFQVRPESDAWYQSSYEPWSRYLTGRQGVAPDPLWDPMAYLIKGCHERGMSFHAWINPFRAATSISSPLAPNHPYYKNPGWFLTYNKQLLYNPAKQECRDYICAVVRDIVTRYDVDAIHLDDYFYPYPVAGLHFPDRADYESDPRGFGTIADWRRDNVNLLIAQLKGTIERIKPYVRLGISPFGIYRNYVNDKRGSRTSGLQNYDDLYADILLWDKEGWVDYVMPQLYWNIGYRVADYTELAYWWHDHIKRAHLYIGQDVKRTMNAQQLHPKMVISERTSLGNCFWPADEIFKDYRHIGGLLKTEYWTLPALPPSYPNSSGEYIAPSHVRNLRVHWTDEAQILSWDPPLISGSGYGPKLYVVYCFDQGDTDRDTSTAKHIVAVTSHPYYRLPLLDGKTKVIYYVTFVNRYNCESPRAEAINAIL